MSDFCKSKVCLLLTSTGPMVRDSRMTKAGKSTVEECGDFLACFLASVNPTNRHNALCIRTAQLYSDKQPMHESYNKLPMCVPSI